MNNVIKKQLQNLKKCQLPQYSEDTLEIFIPKNSIKKELGLEVNHCYQIEIADYVLNPPPEFSLAQNWNNNTIPPYKYMNVCIIQLMGKMIKVDGIGFDIDNQMPLSCAWSGWLPRESIKVRYEI